jgi:hypothetical protein
MKHYFDWFSMNHASSLAIRQDTDFLDSSHWDLCKDYLPFTVNIMHRNKVKIPNVCAFKKTPSTEHVVSLDDCHLDLL